MSRGDGHRMGKERDMNMIENELFQAIVRGMRREFEREMIAGIRTIRLELVLLSKQDRIDELEASEWARLEPVG
jgi:hypothetical protein